MKWAPVNNQLISNLLQGHDWTTKVTLNKNFFQYKYVVITEKEHKSVRWEEGTNRIADLLLLSK